MEINPLYLKKETLEKIKDIFNSSEWLPSAKIKYFLNKEDYKKIKNEIIKLKFNKNKKLMHYSYSKTEIPEKLNKFVNSDKFKKIIFEIAGENKINFELRRFGWRDYILLNDLDNEKNGIDVILEFTENWNEEFGGETVYTNSIGFNSKIIPEGNTLNIIKRENVQRFVKYVNNKAKNRFRYFLIGQNNL